MVNCSSAKAARDYRFAAQGEGRTRLRATHGDERAQLRTPPCSGGCVRDRQAGRHGVARRLEMKEKMASRSKGLHEMEEKMGRREKDGEDAVDR